MSAKLLCGDVHPLVAPLNAMLAQVDQVDFRDPGASVQRFGEYTRRGVAQFQSTHGLTPRGLVDLRTWQVLRDAVRHAQAAADRQPYYTVGNDFRHDRQNRAIGHPRRSRRVKSRRVVWRADVVWR